MWTVNLYKTTGSGPTRKSDLSKSQFSFYPRDKKSTFLAIAKIVFYQIASQNTFVRISTHGMSHDSQDFLLTDICGIYTHDQLSFYGSEAIRYKPSYWTHTNGYYTAAKLEQISSASMAASTQVDSEYLTMDDLRYLPYFSPPERSPMTSIDYLAQCVQMALFQHPAFQELHKEDNKFTHNKINLELEYFFGTDYRSKTNLGRVIEE